MSDDRSARIDALVQSALATPAAGREAFVRQACAGDAFLADEILSLLGHAASAASFLESPAVTSRAPLEPGRQLGPYRIETLLGAGGMGEVYRASDSRLGRVIAVKVLPPDAAFDAERRQRFEREARSAAALNHPNIVTLHSVEEAEGLRFLTMELVEGQPLADLIPPDGLPLDRLLQIAIPLADALGAAHAHGIVHRDLKPANVMVTPEGRVKVLDFGLAKLKPVSAMMTDRPTAESSVTERGRLLGTVAYMSPEQAEGRDVDERTDVFSFGVALYELATGRRPFGGDTSVAVLSAILKDAPPAVTDLKPELPRAFARIIRRCLVKDREHRYQSAKDLRADLEELEQEVRSGGLAPGQTEPRAPTSPVPVRWRPAWMPLSVGVALVAGFAVGALVWRTPPAALSVIRGPSLEVSPAEEVGTGSVLDVLPGGSRRALAWSPDGKTLAFIGLASGVRRIYLRDLDKEVARPLEGTENARSLTFSPDGQWVAFWAAAKLAMSPEDAIWMVRTEGGLPTKICDAARVSGMYWGSAGIVYTASRQLLEVLPDRHDPQALLESDRSLSSPVLLPGDTAVMYTEHAKLWTSGDERVFIQPLSKASKGILRVSGKPKVLLPGAADAQYLSTGHLAFLRQGTLYVAPFDAALLEVHGGEVMLKEVAQAVAAWSGADLTLEGQFAISPQGSLAYLPGSPSMPVSEPVAVNRGGEATPLGARPDSYRERIEASPDGTTFALNIQTPVSRRLNLYDRVRGTSTAPLPEASDQETFSAVWSRDGRIALSVLQRGAIHLVIYTPGSAEAPQLVSDSTGFIANSWSPDGEGLVGTRNGDLWLYSPKGQDSKWTQLTTSPKAEQWPAWSPDGRWLAYWSDTNISGRGAVYVQPVPGSREPIQISTDRCMAPAWNPGGKELFYIQGPLEGDPLELMSVDMSTPDHPGRPGPLFRFSPKSLLFAQCSPSRCYSVAADGQTFYTLRTLPRQPARVTQIKVIFNWFEEVKRLLKAR